MKARAGAPVFSPQDTRVAALAQIAAAFAAAGLADARREARHVLLAALGLAASELVLRPDAPLGPGAVRLPGMVQRRLDREPLSRILGHREFFGLEFALNEATLDPRPDTEILVEAVLDHAARLGLNARPARVLDLGTGSGAIITALLRNLPMASGTGTDVAPRAIEAARANFDRHNQPERARFIQSDWFFAVAGLFDVIVSNPPYIRQADMAGLEREVAAFDPAAALTGGADGLDAYRAIIGQAGRHLAPGGFLALEIGADQAEDVVRLLETAGWAMLETRKDLAGRDRVLVAARSSIGRSFGGSLG